MTAFDWVAQLNAAKFAGYSDWRLPNVRELGSITDASHFEPAVSPAFHSPSCGSACVDLTDPQCSCTQPDSYWCSTSAYAGNTSFNGIVVQFEAGSHTLNNRIFPNYIRAVRGGS